MAEENAKKVNVRIPADRVKGILSIVEDWRSSRAADVQELHRRREAIFRMLEKRIAFFEKLILFAGGSFALSLSFVSSLHKHDIQNLRLEHIRYLESAWVSMVVCMGLGWLHNWYVGAAVDKLLLGAISWDTSLEHAANARFAKRASDLFEGVKAEDVDFGEFYTLASEYLGAESKKEIDNADKFKASARVVLARASRLGKLVLLAVMIAFTLLLLFAIMNIALL